VAQEKTEKSGRALVEEQQDTTQQSEPTHRAVGSTVARFPRGSDSPELLKLRRQLEEEQQYENEVKAIFDAIEGSKQLVEAQIAHCESLLANLIHRLNIYGMCAAIAVAVLELSFDAHWAAAMEGIIVPLAVAHGSNRDRLWKKTEKNHLLESLAEAGSEQRKLRDKLVEATVQRKQTERQVADLEKLHRR